MQECELLELFVAYDIHENNGERSGVISKDDFAKVVTETDSKEMACWQIRQG